MTTADKNKRIDCSDLPARPFVPLDCRKQVFAHLVTNPDKRIITLLPRKGGVK